MPGPADFTDFIEALELADLAAEGDSNDLEIETLQEVRDIAMGLIGVERDENGRYVVASQYCNLPARFPGTGSHVHVCHEEPHHSDRHVCSCGASWITRTANEGITP